MELFWPDADLDAGRNNLSTALRTVRRVLEAELGVPPAEVIRADRAALQLAADGVVTDVGQFEAALPEHEPLRREYSVADAVSVLVIE